MERDMPQTPKDPSEMSLEELGRHMKMRKELPEHLAAKAEFDLRQIRAQIEATDAQKAAAKAEQIAANASIEGIKVAKRNAKYILASVVVAAISAIASAVSAYFAYWAAVHPR
jgi:hypothetical protein